MTAPRRVGLIGLGAMGQGVAANLLRAGFDVHGCDVRAEAREAFTRAGGRPHATPAAVGTACEVLVVLVVNAAQVEDVLFGPDGAAGSMKRGGVVVVSATTSPSFVERLARRLGDHGLLLLDAPVTGGVTGAAAGTLTMLTAGSAQAYAACEDVLAAISARVFRFGSKPGLGAQAKVINQLLVGVHIAVAAEAMAFGMRKGVDPQLLHEALCSGAANSWVLGDRGPRMFSGSGRTETALDIFVKDLQLVLDAAGDAEFPVPLASAAHQLFAQAADAGLGRADDSAVVRVYPGSGE
jgi:3-hydroxyisobutyrate dehydrogenase